MAIKLETEYPGRTIVDGSNPFGTFKDSIPAGSLNGTPGKSGWARDMWSFLEILMSEGSVTHNGSPDDATASQRYEALVKIARNVWPEWDAAHTYSLGAFSIGSDGNWYQSLVPANIGNDPISSPTEWADVFQILDDRTREAPRDWETTFDYPTGALVLGTDDKIYKSLTTPNIGNDPTTPSPAQWRLFVIDDVISTFPDVALSANQGKLLQDAIDAIAALINPATQTTPGFALLPRFGTIANNGGSPTDTIDFSARRIVFDDGSGDAPGPPWSKIMASGWTIGNGNNGLDTGAPAIDTWYYCFAIYNPTTEVADYLFSLSPASPTLPADYTKKRYCGAIYRDSSDIALFHQYGKYFYWDTEVLSDFDFIKTTARNIELDVPDSIATWAIFSYSVIAILGVGGTFFRYVRFYTPGIMSDVTVTAANCHASQKFVNNVFEQTAAVTLMVPTNNLGEIRVRASSIVNTENYIITRGWLDPNLED